MRNLKPDIKTVWHLLAVAAVGAAIYSNTLTASFQFDDRLNIVDNPLIRSIRNLWPPSGGRWFGFLTFALNYMSGGLDPVGYHLVNTSIHILTAVSVYWFVRITFRTPYFSGHPRSVIPDAWLAFAAAVVFVAHPVQTQAVTYIVQRFASLAALLFMLSLDFYILARLRGRGFTTAGPAEAPRDTRAMLLLYTAAALSALLSLKTKENAFTLPLVAVMYDLMFISGPAQVAAAVRRHRRAVAAVSLPVLACAGYIVGTCDLPALFDTFRATNEISRHDYLITQFRVIITYIRLLFLPVGQTIDHYYPVYRSILEPSVLASLAGLLLLLSTALCLLKASRTGNRYLRLVSFGIFWFFVTLSIESSIIPIIDVMFEHRLYLPGIGAIIAVTAATAHLLEKPLLTPGQARRSAALVLAAAVMALSIAAYVRNGVWKNELTLWSDAIAKKPLNPRGYNMLGSYYRSGFRIYDAIYYYRKALEVDSNYAEARTNLGNAYIQTGRFEEGMNELMAAAASNRFDAIDAGILYYNIGKGFYQKGMIDQAVTNLTIALRFNPAEPWVHFLLGEAYRKKNMPTESAASFRKAHELDPGKF